MMSKKRRSGSGNSTAGKVGRRATGVILILVFIAALVGIAAAPQEAGEKKKKATDFRVGYDQRFDHNLNVFRAQTGSYIVYGYMYDLFPYNWRLADNGPDKKYSLTLDHEVSEDGLVYTFHLREGVRWSDGEDFTADDVVFSYNAYHDAPANVLKGYVTAMESIEAVDDYTVVYTLKRPDARVLSAYVPVLPEHIWGDESMDEIHKFDPCCPVVATGGWTMTEKDEKGTSILEPNPYFWGPKSQIERILFIKYGDKEAQLRDIKLNQLDAVYDGDAKWIDDVEEDPNVDAWPIPLPGFDSIAFNLCPAEEAPEQNTCAHAAEGVRTEVVQDLAIRQALAWAIDRQNLVDNVYSGQADPGNGIISPYFARYFQSFADDPEVGYGFDPDRARQILADGGWVCPPEGICEKDGVKAEFEMLVRAEDQEDQNSSKRIKAWASDVGIQINNSIITEDALYARNYPDSPEGYIPDYDAFIWGWVGDLPSPDFNFEVLLCGSGWSDTFYCNPDEYDPLPKDALQELDFDTRVEQMHEAERIALRDVPYIYLAHSNQIQFTRNDTWTGFQPQPSPKGYPFGSWLQMSLLTPGAAASAAYSGAPVTIAVMVIGIFAAVATSYWQRRREETGPLELPEQTTPAPAGG
jgi:peptide/nickel transport system substrate-binding protein